MPKQQRTEAQWSELLSRERLARQELETIKRSLEQEREFLNAMLENLSDGIVACDEKGILTIFNRATREFHGLAESPLPPDEWARHYRLYHPDGKTPLETSEVPLYRALRGEVVRDAEILIAPVDKPHRLMLCNGQPIITKNGEQLGAVAVMHDISDRKAAERAIEHLAYYDSLTQLPNRHFLHERLKSALRNNEISGRQGALLFIDLDNFKTLNDTLGHDLGDLLLQHVARRIVDCLRQDDIVARIGGDEFVILLEDITDSPGLIEKNVTSIANKIINAFTPAFELKGYEYYSTPSIGITLFDGRHESVDDLLKRADIAMYQAKAAGRNTIRFFNPQMESMVTMRVAMESELRTAVDRKEFTVHYQPQVDTHKGVYGIEALVRWQHPQRGLVSPADFIPIAEETGLILPIGDAVLETACQQLREWSELPCYGDLSISVNVSAHQFRNPAFVDRVSALVNRHAVKPDRLKLELTESLLLENVEEAVAKMNQLKAHGVDFSLDDFGTGYSSLAYLKRLPLEQLKIDRSFVHDVLTDANDAAIIRTIIALGNSLGLDVIAEGVETEAQRDFLVANGCSCYQGYLYSRPLAIEQLSMLLQF
ncbi:diguanylate cyclase (GGDEF)-like protein/PAS domain S-box-containing protein [Methylohalomonas lacus]|uniref:cyclic-guanylate-specific phosphodiesterase n=1 Tax=Methylohalomonas lacus TaxID=398773 RepID=A0AAE3L1I4_9GAMM|nr:GGDEF domain-containing phosphodiesterase [Methylohalomonas lacus]MCS3903610.1 diguanylate cyclase (GGDEF)-like protein/PAS domain S-box-containing protein [Methylohalomonas lacus]